MTEVVKELGFFEQYGPLIIGIFIAIYTIYIMREQRINSHKVMEKWEKYMADESQKNRDALKDQRIQFTSALNEITARHAETVIKVSDQNRDSNAEVIKSVDKLTNVVEDLKELILKGSGK